MAHWREFLDPAAPPGDYLTWKMVAKRTSLSRTTAWRLQRRDDFPQPVAISPGRVGYRESEVEAWRASRDTSEGRLAAARRGMEHVTSPRAPTPRASPEPPPGLLEAAGRRSSPPAAVAPSAVARQAPRPVAKRRRQSEHARAIAQQMRFDF